MTEGEIQQPRERHLGLIITLIIILIASVGVILYLLNLLPAQIADMVIKPTERVTSSGARFVTKTVNSVADMGANKKGWPDEPFSPAMANHVWRINADELFGIEFDADGKPMYFIHGMKGSYNFDEAPLDGEHVYWNGGNQNSNELNALDPGIVQGYWLRYTAVRDLDRPWGKILAGQVDYKYRQESGHGLTFLNKGSIKSSVNANAAR